MLKLRLKRMGRKRTPFYRLVIMESTTKRDGRAIDELGYYNPINKNLYFDTNKIIKWLQNGVKPTKSVINLLKKSNINISI